MADNIPSVPDEQAALAALQRYRQHPTEKDYRLVQQWLAAAKGQPQEYARRIALTR